MTVSYVSRINGKSVLGRAQKQRNKKGLICTKNREKRQELPWKLYFMKQNVIVSLRQVDIEVRIVAQCPRGVLSASVNVTSKRADLDVR